MSSLQLQLMQHYNSSVIVYQDLEKKKIKASKICNPPVGNNRNHLNPCSKVHLQTSWNKGKIFLRNNKEG